MRNLNLDLLDWVIGVVRVKRAWAAMLLGVGEPKGVKRLKLSTVEPMWRRLLSAFRALAGYASLELMLDFATWRVSNKYIFSHDHTLDFFQFIITLYFAVVVSECGLNRFLK
jgi:hypothetical protein